MARRAFGVLEFERPAIHDAQVVTPIDLAAERIIIDHLLLEFPDHSIRSEESGTVGKESDWLWLVDPLDGTSNFSLGIPQFGITIALLHHGQPVLGVVVSTHAETTLVGIKGRGARKHVRGRYTELKSPSVLQDVVALEQGYETPRGSSGLSALRDGAESSFSRVLYNWAPSIDTVLLVEGSVCGVIGFQCSGLERAACLLVAQEAQLLVFQSTDRDEFGIPKDFIICWPSVQEKVLPLAATLPHTVALVS